MSRIMCRLIVTTRQVDSLSTAWLVRGLLRLLM
nr:MAG TPA: hypothetical protein [Caudoviricetes sp.]